MASHPGFRLPPIGELGLRTKTSPREDLGQLKKSHDGFDNIREQAARSELLDLRSQKKRITAENSIDESSDKVALIKRNDLISRDSGLEIESPNESKEKLEHVVDVVVKTRNKVSRRKEGRRSPRRKVRSNSPAVIPFTNECNRDEKSNELIPQHHVIMPAKADDTELSATESKLTEPISNGIDLETPGSKNLDEAPGHMDYRELAIKLANNYSRPKTVKRKRTFVDYVLVFDNDDENEFNEKQREIFEKALSDEDIDVSRTPIGNHTYVELCCSFERLCQEAETIFLEMPLLGLSLHHNATPSKSRWKSFQSEREVDDICIPFCDATKEIFDGGNNKNKFFRPALRSLLVHQILKTMKQKTITNEPEGMEQHNVDALANLLHSDVYTDAFILHERSSLDPRFPWSPFRRKSCEYPCESTTKEEEDRREDLHMTWLASFKFQPLWKIRNYFGEKIALYFAWLGMLITSLWVPMCIGIGVFIYGLTLSFVRNESSTWSRVAFDNDLTPGFALLICLWGTVFLEVWKRKNAELAYKWDVDDFEEQEPNRPQFSLQLNPVSGLYEPLYSPLKRTLKTMGSMSLIFFMVLLVLGSLVSVIIYRVIARVDWFTGKYSTVKSNLTSSILNSTSIMLLGFLYKLMAKKLTEWENHRTQTQFEDSLILKLFGFQFVNSYSSLYYIAFFRERTNEGILGKGSRYTDACGASNDCMSLLSLQVGTLMLMKPMPKLFTDVVIPLLQKAGRSCLRKCKRNKILDDGSFVNENLDSDIEFEDYVEHERKKPPVRDFTLSEYTEKVIQYGYLMLFAAAFPLAPLIAVLTNLIDMRVDARRLLWLNRRPIPARAQDIGMWFTILHLLNYIGVITNGFIIAITSSFGHKYRQQTVFNVFVSNTTSVNGTSNIVTTTKRVDTLQNLWIIIIFQNITFIVKFILEYSIPDEPEKVRLARKKEKDQIEGVLKRVGYRRGRGKSIVPAVSKMNPRNGEPINIENTTRTRKESMREKLQKLSQERKKSRKKMWEIEENPKKRKEKRKYFVDEEGDMGHNVDESEA